MSEAYAATPGITKHNYKASLGQEQYWIELLRSYLSHAELMANERNPVFAKKYQELISKFHHAYEKCDSMHDMILVYNLREKLVLNQPCPIFEHYCKIGFKATLSSMQAKQWTDTKIVPNNAKDVVERRRLYYDAILRVKELRHAFRALVEFCAPLMDNNNEAHKIYNEFINFSAYEIVFLTPR